MTYAVDVVLLTYGPTDRPRATAISFPGPLAKYRVLLTAFDGINLLDHEKLVFVV
jgi:hypothetical protein